MNTMAQKSVTLTEVRQDLNTPPDGTGEVWNAIRRLMTADKITRVAPATYELNDEEMTT